jgi:hypothetical protein
MEGIYIQHHERGQGVSDDGQVGVAAAMEPGPQFLNRRKAVLEFGP